MLRTTCQKFTYNDILMSFILFIYNTDHVTKRKDNFSLIISIFLLKVKSVSQNTE